MTPPASAGLQGRRGLVVGIVNKASIAAGCARAFVAAGATVAATCVNAKAEACVRAVTDPLGCPLLLLCGVRVPGARQLRSSAGVAVLVAGQADKAHWMAVGRSCQRFALQAAALGLRHAFLNQPVEVPSLRDGFAALAGIPGRRPDLVVRFGCGPGLPRSLRRPVWQVLA